MKIWLDDEREMPTGFDKHVTTAEEAISCLTTGNVTAISLDHDLGESKNGTGYDVACFIEQAAYSGQLLPIVISIHSANPVGRIYMGQAVARAEEFWLNRKLTEKIP